MKRTLAMGLVGLALLCLCGSAFATDYYVATDGDDGWPGTQAQPWATLQYAVDTIAPGDTILVRAGTYVGCRIEISGQAGALKTLKAYPGETPLVNAAGPANKKDSNIEIENYEATTGYWVVDGFEVANALRYGIDMRDTEYITVQNCYVHDSAVTGIFDGHANYPTYQYNESGYNGEHGIYHSNSGDYLTARGNVLHNNAGCGIHQNGDERYTPPGDGLISFSLVEDNIISENNLGQGAAAMNNDGVTESIFRNNLLYSNAGSGISLYAQDGAAGSSYNEIYNNTLVMADDAYYAVNIIASKGNTPDPVGNKIFNNVLYNPNPGSLRGCIRTYDEAVPGFESDYNVVCEPFAIGDKAKTFATWQSWGYDLHSFMATPDELFVNPAGNDYHLKVGSLAIDAGTTLAAVTDDIEGTSRPQGSAYDIGCYEAASGPAPPVANFSGNPTSGNAPLTVYFTDLSSGSPTSWDWSFGDSGSSGVQHPSHEYTAVNTYTVSLTATNAQGQDTETKIDYITVSNLNCHVGAIDLVGKEKTTGAPSGRGYYAEATITAHDQDCAVLAGVTVDITWSGCVSGSDSGVTDETGQVMFTSAVNPSGGTFTCCVDDLTKAGYPYNSGANHETCDNIVNP
ncbi:MAG: right-handed parallel beta-helix repeat-containing protein [Proteobacteria bacterium]|nr:right-handed parallel beta-helix repeat-containing protein [Pseudomonadota bacterium]